MSKKTQAYSQHGFFQWLLAVVMTVTFVTLAVTLTLRTRSLYVSDMHKEKLAEHTGYSEEVIMEQYDALIAYNLPGGPETLAFPGLPSSIEALIHFAEAKEIFLFFQRALPIGLFLSVVGLFCLRKTRLSCLLYAGILSLAIPASIAAAAVFVWDRFFLLFHELAFANDYWLFSPETDPIIQLLPDQYFMHCAILIVAITAVCGVISFVLYWIKARFVRGRGGVSDG